MASAFAKAFTVSLPLAALAWVLVVFGVLKTYNRDIEQAALILGLPWSIAAAGLEFLDKFSIQGRILRIAALALYPIAVHLNATIAIALFRPRLVAALYGGFAAAILLGYTATITIGWQVYRPWGVDYLAILFIWVPCALVIYLCLPLVESVKSSTEKRTEPVPFRCGHCGASISPDAVACQSCGVAFRSNTTT